jgi:hypothetical protein
MEHIKSINEFFSLKTFNEARLDYRKYANELTAMGHKNRGATMLDYAIGVEKEEEEKKRIQREEEKRKRLKENRDEVSRFEPFNLIIGGSQQKRGKFYIIPSVEIDWFNDMLWDWIDDKMSYIISLPFEFGIMAADEETEATFENWPWSPEQWDGVSYPNRMYLSITNTNSPAFDSYDNDIFYFSTRADAVRFKKMFVDLLEEKNEWYFRKWYPNGFVDRIKKYVSPDYVSELIEKNASRAEEKDKLEEAEQLRNLLPRSGELNYQNVIDSAKNIRINKIYKD